VVRFRLGIVALLAVILLGCTAPATRGPGGADGGPPATGADQGRTLVLTARAEPDTIANKEVLRVSGLSFSTTPRLFNAGLVILDGREVPRPYLVESLPQLNTDSWRLLPDGRMETSYVLRPNLTWHDGTPLTANDFVFGWQVYSHPDLGQSTSPPLNQMEEASAPDARTFVIRWRSLYPDAGAVADTEFAALPRHLLEQAFQADAPEAFARLPFWTTQYVGAGPYKLDRWEPGAFLEGSAFPGHVWGKPVIERVRVRFITDFNTVLATMLAGEAHVTVDDSIRFQQGAILRREWAPRQGGTILTTPDQWRRSEFQLRSEFTNPRSLLDLRVRRALAHAVDKAGLNEALFEGEGILADSFIPPTFESYPTVERLIRKYPLDVRQTEQLMTEAGFTRAGDGVWTNADGRFSAEIKVNASAQSEAEMAIMAEGWRRAGFEFREVPVPQAQSRNPEIRGSFPAMYTGGGSTGDGALPSFVSANIARAENRWVGNNRSGFVSADYDRIAAAYDTTLERDKRQEHLAQAARIFTEEVPAISLYFNPGIVAHIATIEGPQAIGPTADVSWNIHEWRWRS
jgi:peptide/nickel transport system substrate-binding protein